ncbi:MAG: hypothetical protein PHU21_10625 [Elusimicrobia bacterium]|nr:hypothetical protein [Elusimicrobiota bacterium]
MMTRAPHPEPPKDLSARIFDFLLTKAGIAGATAAITAFCVLFSLCVGFAVFRGLGLPHVCYVLAIAVFCPVCLAAPISFGIYKLVLQIDRERLELERTQRLLQASLSRVKELSGLLPICTSCKRIRDHKGDWSELESYLSRHSRAEFRHGLCPDCTRQPQLDPTRS